MEIDFPPQCSKSLPTWLHWFSLTRNFVSRQGFNIIACTQVYHSFHHDNQIETEVIGPKQHWITHCITTHLSNGRPGSRQFDKGLRWNCPLLRACSRPGACCLHCGVIWQRPFGLPDNVRPPSLACWYKASSWDQLNILVKIITHDLEGSLARHGCHLDDHKNNRLKMKARLLVSTEGLSFYNPPLPMRQPVWHSCSSPRSLSTSQVQTAISPTSFKQTRSRNNPTKWPKRATQNYLIPQTTAGNSPGH